MHATRSAIAGAIAAVALALAPAPAAAQEPVRIDCKAFAGYAGHLGYLKEMNADLVRVTAEIRTTFSQEGELVIDYLVAEARRVWQHRLGRDRAEETAYERCMAVLGEIGKEG